MFNFEQQFPCLRHSIAGLYGKFTHSDAVATHADWPHPVAPVVVTQVLTSEIGAALGRIVKSWERGR
jgi:hypothetical protein